MLSYKSSVFRVCGDVVQASLVHSHELIILVTVDTLILSADLIQIAGRYINFC